MTTGHEHFRITTNKLVKSTDFSSRLQTPLREDVLEQIKRVYPQDGAFATKFTLGVLVADVIQIGGGPAGTDGEGHILDLSSSTDDGSNTPFENANTIVYHVALAYIERPKGLDINPRTGQPEYGGNLEDVGVKADPSSVTDNGSNLTINVNSVLESGVDHSGRSVVVYLKTPQGTSEGAALETVVVSYAAPNNTITTTGLLGQSTPSTTPADYEIVALGPMVRRNTDLSAVNGILYLGTVTGGGATNPPDSSDTSGQTLIDSTLSNLNTVLNEFTNTISQEQTLSGDKSPMAEARTNHAACFSPSTGLMVVLGGHADPLLPLDTDTVEAFDPVGDSWSSRTAIPSQSPVGGGPAVSARNGLRAAEVNGIIYVVGGYDEVAAASTPIVQRYNPSTDTWDSVAADLPAARYNGAIGVIDGKIYYAGGQSDPTTGHATTYCYDPVANSWSTVAANSINIALSGFAVVNDELVSFGGVIPAGFATVIDDIWIYNPSADAWREISVGIQINQRHGSDTLYGLCCATVNGVVHGFCGKFPQAAKSLCHGHFVWNYRDETFEWLESGSYGGRFGATAIATDDGMIIIAGGNVEDVNIGPNGGAVPDTFALNAAAMFVANDAGIAAMTGYSSLFKSAGFWDASSRTSFSAPHTWRPLPIALIDHSACAFRDRIYVAGGIDSSAVAQEKLYAFYPATNTWQTLADMPAARSQGTLLVDEENEYLYWACGWDGTTVSGAIYRYNIVTDVWTTFSNAATARRLAFIGWHGGRIHMMGGIDAGGAPLATYTVMPSYDTTQITGPAMPATRYGGGGKLIIISSRNNTRGDDAGEYTAWAPLGFRAGVLNANALVFSSLANSYTDNVSLGGLTASWFNVADYCDPILQQPYQKSRTRGRRILTAMGHDGSVTLSSANLYNPSDGTTQALSSLPVAKSRGATACLDGAFYIFGGTTDNTAAGATTTVLVNNYMAAPHPKSGTVRNYAWGHYDVQGGKSPTYVAMEGQSIGFDQDEIFGWHCWHHRAINKFARVGRLQ